MSVKKFVILFFILVMAIPWQLSGQEKEAKKDSVETPFRKKRWLTMVTGSIASSAINGNPTGSGSDVFSNRYSVNIALSYFMVNRLSVGLSFNAYRNSSRQLLEREVESMTVGPFVTYYLSKNNHGSVFFHGGLGYGKYREEDTEKQDTVLITQNITGNEFGGSIGLGYSHVVLDKLAFSISMMYDIYRVNTTLNGTQYPENEKFNATKIQVRFLFGFAYFLK
jgi:hypothetical protein